MQSLAQLLPLTEGGTYSVMIRSTIKKMVLRWSIDSITESFEDYVRKHPDCRLCDVSAAVLPGNLGKRSRLFASHIMDDLVRAERVVKYNRPGSRYPLFVVQ